MPRVIMFYKPGSPDVLQIEDRPVRPPSTGEVLLAVEAIGLNRAEIAFRQGLYIEVPDKYPVSLGFEAAGVITEMGPGVADFEVGDHVVTMPVFSMREYGVYGDLVLAPANSLTRYPKNLSAVEAASVWMASLTAYGGLLFLGDLKPGQFVLITAATGSVGITAIQIAKWIGAKVIVTTRAADKKQRLLDAGADHVVVVTEENMVDQIDEITLGAGVNVCFDAVGGGMVSKLVKVAAFGADLILYGSLSTELTIFPLLTALRKCVTLHAYRNRALVRHPEEREKAERFIFDRLAEGSVHAFVDRIFSLEQVRDAHRYLESNEQVGKIVLIPREPDAPKSEPGWHCHLSR